MKVIVAWSGGKDSQASLIWAAKEFGVKNITAVFCDTGWENPITLLHVVDVCEQLGVELKILRSSKYEGFEDMAIKKKRAPSTKARFCTEELKTKPMIDFILKQSQHLLIIQGIRADESNARSKMEKQCRFFKYYFEPYGLDKYEKPKFHHYRKKEVINWVQNYSDDIIRPYFNATASAVMSDIFSAGQKPNQLYYMGRKRVGCDPCIMCSHSEIKAMVRFTPDSIGRLKQFEKRLGRSFFPPGYIPDRHCSGFDINGKVYPTVDDVIAYLTSTAYNPELFTDLETQERRCMSFYGICE
jgi:3'-phosphoadenosine 5'-phosphosulfate sulfotransferase (PAPS reductase)/FAD synthetase